MRATSRPLTRLPQPAPGEQGDFESVARHSSQDEYTFAELLALIEEHRHDLTQLTRAKLNSMDLRPRPVHFPHVAGTEYTNPSPDFSQTLDLDEVYLDRTIRFVLRDITRGGEFASAQGEFLVATGKDFRKFGMGSEHYAALESALVEAIGEHIGVTKKLSDTINLGCSLLAYGAIEDEEAELPATSAAKVLEVLIPVTPSRWSAHRWIRRCRIGRVNMWRCALRTPPSCGVRCPPLSLLMRTDWWSFTYARSDRFPVQSWRAPKSASSGCWLTLMGICRFRGKSRW